MLIENKFTGRRLAQIPATGAVMSVRKPGRPMVWVSNVRFGDGIWTRVEEKSAQIVRHYRETLSNEDAADAFFQEIDAAVAELAS